METKSERTVIDVSGASMGAYVARPDGGGTYPGVLLFMEVFGINAHIRSVADRIAAKGYVVMAPDLFHRTGPGIELDYDEAGLSQGIALMGQVKVSEVIDDLKAAHSALAGRDDVSGRGIGAVGFCFGGHAAYLAAAELPLAATASFYGGGIAGPALGGGDVSTIDRTGSIAGRILCLFGDNDPYISAEDVESIRGALAKAGTRHEVVVYPGVGHGFCCDVRADYDEASAADAWAKVYAMFADELS